MEQKDHQRQKYQLKKGRSSNYFEKPRNTNVYRLNRYIFIIEDKNLEHNLRYLNQSHIFQLYVNYSDNKTNHFQLEYIKN